MPLPPNAGDPRREEAARRIAWAAVKRSYVKAEGGWRPRSPEERH